MAPKYVYCRFVIYVDSLPFYEQLIIETYDFCRIIIKQGHKNRRFQNNTQSLLQNTLMANLRPFC